jgi:hypothetical protein
MKPLKRFAGSFLPLITGLRPGVNEISISRNFEAKPPGCNPNGSLPLAFLTSLFTPYSGPNRSRYSGEFTNPFTSVRKSFGLLRR